MKILFPLFQQHHKEIEDQAEMAKKTVMEKLGLCFKKASSEFAEEPAYVNYILFLNHWLIYLDKLLNISYD